MDYNSPNFSILKTVKSHQWLKDRQDESSATICLDLDDALKATILTPEERQLLALVYYAELSHRHAAKLIGLQTSNVEEVLASALEKLEAVLMGYRCPRETHDLKRTYGDLSGWLQAVGDGKASIHEVPPSFLNWAALNGDRLAQETLRQRVEGPPTFESEHAGTWREYPFYSEEKLRNMDRQLRVSYVEDVSNNREGTVVGRKKTFSFNDDNTPIVAKTRIYKR